LNRRQNVDELPPIQRQLHWWILALLFSLTVINFVDRQALSRLAPIIRDTFHFSNTQYGTIGASGSTRRPAS